MQHLKKQVAVVIIFIVGLSSMFFLWPASATELPSRPATPTISSGAIWHFNHGARIPDPVITEVVSPPPTSTTTTTVATPPPTTNTSVISDLVTDADRVAWQKVAICETSGNWQMQGSSYSGGVGFANSTWLAYGGAEFASNAGLATMDQQIVIAKRVQSSPPDQAGCTGGW